jgi:release factor glutamine methyltransferase
MNTATASWTTKALLDWTAGFFRKKGVDNPRLSAEMLLAHVLGTRRLALYMEPNRPSSDLERATFRELVERTAKHEPVDYLVGSAPFFSLTLEVNRSVLIPRPSTEALVEHVLQHARRTPGFHNARIADIGTGSGALAVALAKHLTAASVVATDTSEAALSVAQRNAEAHGVAERITFHHGDLYEPLAKEQFEYIVANPPYISDDEWAAVASNVKDHEPTEALRGGVDGLKYLRPLIEHSPAHLARPGQLVLEIAASQKRTVLQLAEKNTGLNNAHVLADHEALPRVLVADAAL